LNKKLIKIKILKGKLAMKTQSQIIASNASILKFPKYDQYTFTNNKDFVIEPISNEGQEREFQINSNYLYIKKNIIDSIQQNNNPLFKLIENGFILSIGIKKIYNIHYYQYQFYRQLKDLRKYTKQDQPRKNDNSLNENDCLQFAETISMVYQNLINPVNQNNKELFDDIIKAKTTPPALFTINNEKFGESDIQNIDYVNKINNDNKNHNALPNNGELYAIVRKEIVVGSAPYHVAFVIYSDDNINITLEAEADNKDDYLPKFCMYDRNPQGFTFHKRWSGELDNILYEEENNQDYLIRYQTLYNNAETIVLHNRPLVEFYSEFEKEQQSNVILKSKSKKTSSSTKSSRKSLIPKYLPKNQSKKRLSKDY
jgi:hypothetical protein